MVTIGSLVSEINARLGNRQDVVTYSVFPTTPAMVDTDRLAGWCKEAYDEIALGYRFEELCQGLQDPFGMTQGNDTYPLPNGSTRFIRAVTLLFPQGSTTQPRPLRRRHIRNIRRYQTFNQGPPAIYAPYPGPAIIVRPVPDQAYNFIWDIQMKPTYSTIPNQTIANTTLQLPDDWLGVYKALVALKGHTALVEHDKAQAQQQYLFGGYDPGIGRRVPGVIKGLIDARDKLDIEDTEYGVQPQIRRYTNTI